MRMLANRYVDELKESALPQTLCKILPSSLGPSSLTQPLMPEQVTVKGSSNNDTVDEALKANTRMNMRRQKDIAAMAGIKCSQF